jgi:hypothetical protein
MRAHPRLLRAALPLGLVLALGGLAGPLPSARAEDGPDGEQGAESLEAQIKAQMEKILRLMRDNEKTLLEASVVGGRRPEGVDVQPPAGPESGAKGETPPAGTTPPPSGEDARRKMEELLKASQQRAGSIPGELENLVKMIPT